MECPPYFSATGNVTCLPTCPLAIYTDGEYKSIFYISTILSFLAAIISVFTIIPYIVIEQRRRWPMLVATLAAHLGFALVWLLVFSITVLLYVSDEAFDKGETALYVVLLTVAASWVLALALTVWVWLQGRNAWAIPIGWLGLACTTSLIAVGVIAGAAV